MNEALHVVPLALAGVGWWGLYRVNLRRRWLRPGELIFWDAILLILVYLAWLRWF